MCTFVSKNLLPLASVAIRSPATGFILAKPLKVSLELTVTHPALVPPITLNVAIAFIDTPRFLDLYLSMMVVLEMLDINEHLRQLSSAVLALLAAFAR